MSSFGILRIEHCTCRLSYQTNKTFLNMVITFFVTLICFVDNLPMRSSKTLGNDKINGECIIYLRCGYFYAYLHGRIYFNSLIHLHSISSKGYEDETALTSFAFVHCLTHSVVLIRSISCI